MRDRRLYGVAIMIAFLSWDSARSDVVSNSDFGINSDSLDLTGEGIAIGQVELNRPGKPDFDTDPTKFNAFVTPTAVFLQDGPVAMNANIDSFGDGSVPERNHATWVASVMISTDAMVTEGVAPMASLYASATNGEGGHEDDAITLQHIAKQNDGDIRAINMSYHVGYFGITDGNALLTQFVDWSAREHEVLYVVAGEPLPDIGEPSVWVPADNFNGITVGASEQVNDVGKWRKSWSRNNPVTYHDGRVGIDILAPGTRVFLAGLDNSVAREDGTSFAAPHVTGTVALLQEHAEERIMNAGAPRWTDDARRHEVMKAVLMNSADKIEGILGMERTVLKRNGMDTWFDSDAHTNANIPLDNEMGAGHLNAKRALDQFAPGEFGPGSVPLIGWDYGFVDSAEPSKYVFDQPLDAGDYVSITVAWDREWILDAFAPPFDEYKPGDQFINDFLENLDLHLLPAGSTDVSQAIWSSTSSVQNVEHIFREIEVAGNYEFWLELQDPGFAFPTQFAAVAWWAGPVVDAPDVPGDYDGNGSVGPEDYNEWKSQFGAVVDAGMGADGNGDGMVDAADYTVWRDNLSMMAGAGSSLVVPEPNGLIVFAVSSALAVRVRRRAA